jgi:cobalt-zinc-cadmium efflux system protein
MKGMGETSHGHTHLGASVPRLRAVLALLLVVLLAELVGGVVGGSVALLADAGHLLSDSAGVALALVAASFATRPALPRVGARSVSSGRRSSRPSRTACSCSRSA